MNAWLRASSVAAILGVGALAAGPAHAQVIEGRVTLPQGGAASRVLLEATRPDGSVAARTLSDDAGRYVVHLPGPGRYALRALRIGFRPTALAAREVAAGERVASAIVLTEALVRLDQVRVAAGAVCDPTWRGDPVVLELWEEARKALQVAQLTAQHSELAMTVKSFEALATRDGVTHPTTLTAYWQEAATVRPFESVPESLLVADGYAVALPSGTIYRAPDFDVLLAPSFVLTHCVRTVVASDGQPGAIGLEFQPNTERRRADIEGVLWLDRESARLRELEFRYTGIASAHPDQRHGGRVRFAALGTGHWIVDAWELRMPRPFESALTVIGGEVGEVTLGERVLLTTPGPFDDVPPTHESVVAMACGEEALGAQWGMLRGEVIEPDGLPARLASVTITWQESLDSKSLSVSTGDDGTWHACRVPRAARLEVRASRGALKADARASIGQDERFAELLLTLGN